MACNYAKPGGVLPLPRGGDPALLPSPQGVESLVDVDVSRAAAGHHEGAAVAPEGMPQHPGQHMVTVRHVRALHVAQSINHLGQGWGGGGRSREGQDPDQDPIQDLWQDPTQDLDQDPYQDLSKDPGQDPDLNQDLYPDPDQDPGQDMDQDPSQDLGPWVRILARCQTCVQGEAG